ncbi:MAG: redoxin domain-containing protein [Myxococcota bacterium]
MRTLPFALLVALGCSDPAPDAITPTNESAPASAETPTEATNVQGAAEAPAEAPEAPAEEALTATLGQPAPNFTLRDHAGAEHTLADYRGKIVVLEWINPQCPYVQRHYRSETMRDIATAFPEDQVAWLAVDSSHFVTAEDSAAWREEHNLPYPILQDADGAVGGQYNATTTPNMYVVDAQGVLRYRGAIDDDPRGRNDEPRNYVREAVQALVDGGQPSVAETEPYGCSVKYESS